LVKSIINHADFPHPRYYIVGSVIIQSAIGTIETHRDHYSVLLTTKMCGQLCKTVTEIENEVTTREDLRSMGINAPFLHHLQLHQQHSLHVAICHKHKRPNQHQFSEQSMCSKYWDRFHHLMYRAAKRVQEALGKLYNWGPFAQ